MQHRFVSHLNNSIDELRDLGLYKEERIITSKQSSEIEVLGSGKVLNFCSNNYLGLADDADLAREAKAAIDRYGYGMASVRFICGTQEEHKLLEDKISKFLGMEDTILYSSCFDANTGLFETILDENDAIISDELNHASIIDGVRLAKARKFRYANNNMDDLENRLRECENARFKLIATDGVFSMDGIIANLQGICHLAEKYDALVMVDDSHAVGFIGESGRGTPEYCNVTDKVDIITGTLGKALGGASGGGSSAGGTGDSSARTGTGGDCGTGLVRTGGNCGTGSARTGGICGTGSAGTGAGCRCGTAAGCGTGWLQCWPIHRSLTLVSLSRENYLCWSSKFIELKLVTASLIV